MGKARSSVCPGCEKLCRLNHGRRATMDVRPVTRYIRFFLDQEYTMRMWIGVLAFALLAGCSLPRSLVPGEPNVSKTSDKAPKDYAACVLPLWQRDVAKTSQTSIFPTATASPRQVSSLRMRSWISSNTRTAAGFRCIRGRHGPSRGRCANRCVIACSRLRRETRGDSCKQTVCQRALGFRVSVGKTSKGASDHG